MWPFKKKVKEPVKLIKKIFFENKEVEVGRTNISLILKDGRNFNTWIYGRVNQYIDYPRPVYDGSGDISGFSEGGVGEVSIAHSYLLAQAYLSSINSLTVTVVDDPISPTESVVGEIVSAEIGDTEECKIEHFTGRWEES